MKLILIALLVGSVQIASAQVPSKPAPKSVADTPGLLKVTKDANGNTVLSTDQGVLMTESKGKNGSSVLTDNKGGSLKCETKGKEMVCTPQ